MANINDLVVATRDVIEEARSLDIYYDLWTSRMIRWAVYGWPTKSLICGVQWENKQDDEHAYETLAGWRKYYMPGFPAPPTERCLPTYSTGSMSSDKLRERDYNRRMAREQAIIDKHDAGLSLDGSEQEIYDFWVEIQKIGPAPVVVEKNGDAEKTDGAAENQADIHKVNYTATVATPGGFDDKKKGAYEVNDSWGIADWADSPNASPESVQDGAVSENDWGYVAERTLCSVKVSPIELHIQYASGLRGKDYDFPVGIGKHIRAAPITEDSRVSVIGDDALDNIPTETPYTFIPSVAEKKSLPLSKEICGLLTQYGEQEAKIAALYGEEVCHKDNSWLVDANPEVTPEMMAKYQEETERNKVSAIKTLEVLAKIGTNLDLLIPMVQLVLKDPKLCHAIHKELVIRDIGFLKRADCKRSLRFHGRVETVLNSLDRWAVADIESAIEDVRLILEDHELVLEILDAFNGAKTQKDRPLIDPEFSGIRCANCEKDLKELAVIYGRDHSTIMATGCRVCEDTRLKRIHELLWKWHKNPELIDDEQYKKVFGMEKGFKMPVLNEEMCCGNFDCEE